MVRMCGERHSRTPWCAQRWSRRPCGEEAGALESAGATHWSLAQHAGWGTLCEGRGSVICNIRRKLCSLRWHFSHPRCGLQRVVKMSSSRLARGPEHGKTGLPRRCPSGASLDQASGPVGGRVRGRERLDSPAEGAGCAGGKGMALVGRACQIDVGDVDNAPVVPSPSPDCFCDFCGSFRETRL